MRDAKPANRRHMGMAGYASDSECVRYRMQRDMGCDRRIRPRHPIRYNYKTAKDEVCNAIAIVLAVIVFAGIPAYILCMMLDPANWWMW